MTLEISSKLSAEFSTPPYSIAEPNNRSAKRPWEPTPLVPSLSSKHQDEVRIHMLDILEKHRPEYVGDELYEFIEIIHMSRDARRYVKNAESYSNSLYSENDIKNPVLLDAIERAKYGTASIDEVIQVAEVLGMSSIELAKLTHTYGFRLEYIDNMRRDVKEAIELHGGKIFEGDDTKESYRIIGFDSNITNTNKPCHGIAMQRKRQVGQANGYDIHERSTLVVNLDMESGTDIAPQLINYLKNFEINEKNGKSSDSKPSWTREMLRDSNLLDEVVRCIQANDIVSVIPISTTVYAHNPEVESLIEEREKARREENRAFYTQTMPIFTAMQNSDR